MALDDPRATPPTDEPATARRTDDAAGLVGDERLPCGRLVSHAWEQARDTTDQADPHTAGCPCCRQAVEGLAALDEAVHALRTEQPGGQTVADRVMRAVRAEVRLGRLLPLDDPARELRIAETTAAKVLRRAADRMPGVRAASCRLTPSEHGTEVAVAMTLAVTLDEPLPDRATRVRRAVGYAARQELGLAVSEIDLRIVSVLEPVRPTPRALAAHRDGGER
jgi:uncharacterized alkaline shock family protein YloU